MSFTRRNHAGARVGARFARVCESPFSATPRRTSLLSAQREQDREACARVPPASPPVLASRRRPTLLVLPFSPASRRATEPASGSEFRPGQKIVRCACRAFLFF